MLREKLIDKVFAKTELPVKVDRSRCMRMRFDQNECSRCTSNCRLKAITLGDDIAIDADKCTSCMVCVSECPSDCFEIKDHDFFSLLSKLRKIQHLVPYPVLGCKSADKTDAHEKTACLGYLSDEHLLALNVFMDKPVLINLTACAECENYFIVEILKEHMADIKEATGTDVSEKVVPVENKSALHFESISYDRRAFFKALKNITFIHASEIFAGSDAGDDQSYSFKKLPVKRKILNAVLKSGPDKEQAEIMLREYAFSVTVNESCDNCFSCVGMCPAGALKSHRDESGDSLLFNSSMCSGCGLCRDFCLNESIKLAHGYIGDNFFEYGLCNKIYETVC